MKHKNTHKLKITTFIVPIIICLSVIYLHLLSHNKTQKIYLKQTEKTIINMKKEFLKDTVNNVFIEIDKLRKTKNDSYKKNTEYRLSRFEEELDSTDEEFINFFIEKFEDDANPSMWTAFLWDSSTKEILYASSELNTEDREQTKKTLKSSLSSYSVVEKGNIEGIFGVSKSYIDELVKKEIGHAIKNRQFSNESYMWINEVIGYNGGENYAVRRVHPNISKKEGQYLSTNTKDIKGNFPYKEELEGINENGELFFSYFFEKLNSTEISEKITYAKLYKDYDWIIAMGVHLDEIVVYTEEINKEITYSSSEATMSLLRYIIVVLLIGFTIIYLSDKKSTEKLEKEINVDTLTNSYSRRYGERSLSSYLKKYKSTNINTAIMMFDIDDFKTINDKYGHEYGDVVLKEIVKKINGIIRDSDELIRWGGDEFVGILPGLKEENLEEFGEKILHQISSLKIPVEDGIINISISIGFSYFNDEDKDYTDVLKRADTAMYKSKQEGKNRMNI